MAKLTDEAKAQNDEAAKKQKHEEKIADWSSPEELRKTGDDVHPTQKVVSDTRDPSDDPATKGTRYDPSTNGAKTDK